MSAPQRHRRGVDQALHVFRHHYELKLISFCRRNNFLKGPLAVSSEKRMNMDDASILDVAVLCRGRRSELTA
jgi:hypothetical protein